MSVASPRDTHDRVIVKRLEEERQSAGGIVIPDTAARVRWSLLVPARLTRTGSFQPMGVKAGNKVLFGKYSGQEFRLNNEELLQMRERTSSVLSTSIGD